MTVYRLKSKMNFGKYKDWDVEKVLLLHPDYLVWAKDTIEWFELDNDIYEQAFQRSMENLGRQIRKASSRAYFASHFDGEHDEWFGGDPGSYY